MANSTETSGSRGLGDEDPSKLLERLHMQDEEIGDLIWKDEVDARKEKPKWLGQIVDQNKF